MVLLALAVGSATLVTLMVRLAKPGNGLGGAVYLPVESIVPISLELTPTGGSNDQVTAVFVAPVIVEVNCRTPFTGIVTLAFGSIVTVAALAGTLVTISVVTRKRIKHFKNGKYMLFVLLLIYVGLGAVREQTWRQRLLGAPEQNDSNLHGLLLRNGL